MCARRWSCMIARWRVLPVLTCWRLRWTASTATPAELKRMWLQRRSSYAPLRCQRRLALPRVSAGRLFRSRHHGGRQHAFDAGTTSGAVGGLAESQLQTSRLESDGMLQRPGDDGRRDGGALCWREGGGLRFDRQHCGVACRLCGARGMCGQGLLARGTGFDRTSWRRRSISGRKSCMWTAASTARSIGC